jgi:hypothetical protein
VYWYKLPQSGKGSMRPQRSLWAAIFLALVLSHVSGRTLYVSLNSTNPVPPYARWRTAATNIQDAINAASAGDRIIVNDGVYDTGGAKVNNSAQTNRIVVNKAVTVQSVNGPAVTVIDGGFEIRCVYLAAGATLSGFTLTGGFIVNLTEVGGGGVYCESISATVSNCVIGGNVAYYYYDSYWDFNWGGGAYGGTLNNCTLIGNAAEYGAGAAYCTLNNCTLAGNRGGGNSGVGGGAADCILNNCKLTGNGGDVGGGACDCTLYNCTLMDNVVDTDGGGVFGCTLNNCVLVGNASGAASGGGAEDCTLYNCTLTGNRADNGSGGGALSSTLYNCTLMDNTAEVDGGGAAGCTLYNCTLTGNSAEYFSVFPNSGRGGGAAGCTLYNCIVYFNMAAVSGANYDSTCTLNYCDTTPLPTSGIGNIDADPLFVDTNNWSDLRLQPGSPCINAGDNVYVTTATDLDGNPRIVGGVVDMGAYEFQSPALLIQRLVGLANASALQHRQPLLGTLETALASLQRGNSIAAANQLVAFQNKVRAQVAPGDTELAQALIAAAQQVIEAIRPNPNP